MYLLRNRGLFGGPAFVDNFNGLTLNSSYWGTFGTSYGSISVNNGECTIRNATGNSNQLIGIYSLLSFPVGMSLTVRSKNTQGRHSSLIGFGGSPYTPYPHGGGSIGCTWYARADNASSNVSIRGENLATSFATPTSQDLRDYQTFRMERLSSTQIAIYRNDVLEHTFNGIPLANDYPVYFSADGWSNDNVGGTDNIIVIDSVTVE